MAREKRLRARNDAFPSEPLRDLLGVVRALYASERDRRQRERLALLGHELAILCREGPRCAVGTRPHAEMWDRAEHVAGEVGRFVSESPAGELVRIAAARVMR